MTSTIKTLIAAGLFLYALAPVNLPAAQVTLAWDPNSESNLAGYHIYWGTVSRSYENKATIGTETSYPITGLQEETTYYIAVTAYDTDGNESDYSAELAYAVPVTDSDGDGIPDTSEQDVYGTDPQNPDTDGDLMDDGWEIDTGTDPLVDDAGNDLDGDGISNIDEYNGVVPPGTDTPDPPRLNYPTNGENDVPLTPTFQTSAINAASNYAAHSRTQWQIRRSEDFSDLVFDLISDQHLDRLTIPDFILQSNQTYWWRARYLNNWSDTSSWPQAYVFMTVTTTGDDADADGIPDHQAVTELSDLDQNGVPDRQQANIKTLKSAMNGSLIGLTVDAPQAAVMALKSMQPDNVVEDFGRPDIMSAGLIVFKIAVSDIGDTVNVNVYFDRPVHQEASWYKYTLADGWHDYSENAAFSPDRKSVRLTLQDGGFGDADGIANGIIIDPSGFGYSQTAEPAPSGGAGGGGCFIENLSDWWSWPWRSDPELRQKPLDISEG